MPQHCVTSTYFPSPLNTTHRSVPFFPIFQRNTLHCIFGKKCHLFDTKQNSFPSLVKYLKTSTNNLFRTYSSKRFRFGKNHIYQNVFRSLFFLIKKVQSFPSFPKKNSNFIVIAYGNLLRIVSARHHSKGIGNIQTLFFWIHPCFTHFSSSSPLKKSHSHATKKPRNIRQLSANLFLPDIQDIQETKNRRFS